MRPSATYSRLLFPVIASAGAVGLSIGLIIPLTSIVLVVPKVENNQVAPARHLVLRMVYIAPVAMGAGFFGGFLETAVLALLPVYGLHSGIETAYALILVSPCS